MFRFKPLNFLLSNWILSAVLAQAANAAPCCSGSASAPAMITGDDRAQLSASLSRSVVIGDAPVQGVPVFRSADHAEVAQTYRLDGAILLSDRFQVGVSIPVSSRTLSRGNAFSEATRLGDIRVDTAYEVLPEWSYSVWKPRGFGFLQLTFPTGRSIYESRQSSGVDAVGQGFYFLSAGTFFSKRWSNWDAYFTPELHYRVGRAFLNDSAADSITVSSGWGTSVALGAGVVPWIESLRVGLRLQPVWNSSKTITEAMDEASVSNPQLSWDSSIELGYSPTDSWTFSAAYTDQTLLGPAINSTLSRTIALSIQRRWER